MANSISDSTMDDIKTEISESNVFENRSDNGRYNRSVQDPFQPTAADYWYGKQSFREIVAGSLLLEFTDGPPQIPEIDSRFEKLVREFPYLEAFNSLQTANLRVFRTNLLAGDADGHKTLLSLIGTNLRRGTREEQAALRNTINRFIDGRDGSSSPPPARPSPAAAAAAASNQPVPSQNRASPPNQDAETESWVYTSMLKEKADVRGIPLNYKIERAPFDPESFQAELTFHGRVFVGYGKNKQQAKHQASKNACNYLESQRENLV